MKVGDTIAIPGEGEFKLVLAQDNTSCNGCVADTQLSLCDKLPALCTLGVDKIWIKVEK